MRLEALYKNTPYLCPANNSDPDGQELALEILKKI
jgi:hypothetical protein